MFQFTCNLKIQISMPSGWSNEAYVNDRSLRFKMLQGLAGICVDLQLCLVAQCVGGSNVLFSMASHLD